MVVNSLVEIECWERKYLYLKRDLNSNRFLTHEIFYFKLAIKLFSIHKALEISNKLI